MATPMVMPMTNLLSFFFMLYAMRSCSAKWRGIDAFTQGRPVSQRALEFGRRVVSVDGWKHAEVYGPNYKETAAIIKVSNSTLRKWCDRIRDRYGPDSKTAVAL